MEPAQSLTELADNFAILQCIYKFTHAQDNGDVAGMKAMLLPDRNLKFDLSKHLPEIGSFEVSGSQLSEVLKGASAGWTAVQHPVWNPVITRDMQSPGTRVSVDAMVEALHTKGRDDDMQSARVRATWYVDMEKKNGKWYMADMAMLRKIPIDNFTLLMETAQSAGAEITQ